MNACIFRLISQYYWLYRAWQESGNSAIHSKSMLILYFPHWKTANAACMQDPTFPRHPKQVTILLWFRCELFWLILFERHSDIKLSKKVFKMTILLAYGNIIFGTVWTLLFIQSFFSLQLSHLSFGIQQNLINTTINFPFISATSDLSWSQFMSLFCKLCMRCYLW